MIWDGDAGWGGYWVGDRPDTGQEVGVGTVWGGYREGWGRGTGWVQSGRDMVGDRAERGWGGGTGGRHQGGDTSAPVPTPFPPVNGLTDKYKNITFRIP